MSPHATDPSPVETNEHHPPRANGHTVETPTPRMYLKRHNDEQIHDLICIGFGPASLAIAVALHDALESKDPGLRTHSPRVRFLERQEKFAWHAGMLLHGSKMQISFIKDLATLRNPRSHFTFLNYLHQNGRLEAFTNLGTFLPQRIEFEDYLRWSSDHFRDVVDYNCTVQSVRASQRPGKSGAVQYFEIVHLDMATMKPRSMYAKHVVVAVGGAPTIPTCLDGHHPRIIHSSQYAMLASKIATSPTSVKSVAVIGAGQSAAEIFQDTKSRFPEANSYLIIKDSALRPSDDSPFVNQIFDTDRVDEIYSQDAGSRAKNLALDKGTNYGVVRLELLEEIYADLYASSIGHSDKAHGQREILTHRTVTGMTPLASESRFALRLFLEDLSGKSKSGDHREDEALDVDLVIAATGYSRNSHEEILKEIQHLAAHGASQQHPYTVGRDYGIIFQDGAVDKSAGVWLQGCNESTHGLSDTLLSILAVRGGEMVRSIFG